LYRNAFQGKGFYIEAKLDICEKKECTQTYTYLLNQLRIVNEVKLSKPIQSIAEVNISRYERRL